MQTPPVAQAFPDLPFGANVATMSSAARPTALRGPALTFTGDPFQVGLERTLVHEPDAIVAMQDGRITHFGPAARIGPLLPAGTEIRDFGQNALISAGFVDTHVHFPQTPMIASHGAQLLDWLERYTFPAELKFADRAYTRRVARAFLQENLRNGITTSCVYCSVHPHSADILFEEAEALGLRLAAGKVLMNFAANARDAMPDGGTLSVSTHSERVGRAEAERHQVAPGRFVIITVEDTGVGMTPATIARLFEPFFTTKSAGSGTGLGLPTSLAIITGHGGFLQVYSEPDHGSRFQMHLPSTAPTSSPADPVDDEDPPGRGNGELIVVVDDEQEIRDATSRALKSHGYTVAAVSNGQEALDFITAHTDVALVVTDLMMPVMDGATLAASLAQSSPGIPIVAMSGLAGNADRADVTSMSAFLAKPFSTADLIRTVSHWVSPAQGYANG